MKRSYRIKERIHRLQANNNTLQDLKNNKTSWIISSCLILCILGLYAFTDFTKRAQRTVSISAKHMNILYLDVPNPLTVAVAGIPAEEVKLESPDLKLENEGNGHYIATAGKTGMTIIEVSGKGIETQSFEFRVEEFPDVIVVLDHPSILNLAFGEVPSTMFWETKGLTINSRDLDYGLDLDVLSYRLTKVPGRGNSVKVKNEGASLNESSKKLTQSAAFGDVFFFENIVVGAQLTSGGRYVSWTLNKPKTVIYRMNK